MMLSGPPRCPVSSSFLFSSFLLNIRTLVYCSIKSCVNHAHAVIPEPKSLVEHPTAPLFPRIHLLITMLLRLYWQVTVVYSLHGSNLLVSSAYISTRLIQVVEI
ncbi:hypothetical protein F4680DRAFT_190128 [Xylaria scruposa]|nr:hypothetical protein F4680DRAFT_190128 [Xylaria scruposa]